MILEKFNPVIPAKDDGFSMEATGSWVLRKNQIIYNYLQVFTGTMRRKFNYLVYLDLFSGSGLKRVDDAQFTYGSPILALDDSNGFSKFVFCEADPKKVEALKVRVNKYFRHKNVVVFNGNVNKTIDRLEHYIPESTKKHRVSTLCLVDPFSMDIEFETIRALSDMGVNFLVVLSLPWKEENTFRLCLNEERELLNAFLGKPWSELESEGHINSNEVFFRHLVKLYHQNLRSLGYISSGSFYKVGKCDLDVPYFFTGYYSSTRGTKKIHKEVLHKVVPQIRLFD